MKKVSLKRKLTALTLALLASVSGVDAATAIRLPRCTFIGPVLSCYMPPAPVSPSCGTNQLYCR